jgi:hypothetical protein
MSDVSRQALRSSATFGASIRGAREALGLSQASCARRMLTSAEAAFRMGRTDRWLRNMRRLGLGPAYTRYNGWQPLYDPDLVDAWVRNQLAKQVVHPRRRRRA